MQVTHMIGMTYDEVGVSFWIFTMICGSSLMLNVVGELLYDCSTIFLFKF